MSDIGQDSFFPGRGGEGVSDIDKAYLFTKWAALAIVDRNIVIIFLRYYYLKECASDDNQPTRAE